MISTIRFELPEVEAWRLKNVPLEDALEYTGSGKYNIQLTLTCGLCFFAVCNEAWSVGYVLPLVACELDLDTFYKGLMTSANFIGLALSGLLWGCITDLKGRKNCLIVCLLVCFATSFACSLVVSFWGLFICRFLTGFFMSGPAAIIYAYFGEFHCQTRRPKAMACLSLFQGLSLVFLPGLSWLTQASNIDVDILGIRYHTWRLYFALNSLPNLVTGLALLGFPESPKFLHHTRKTSQALNVLRDMYEANSGQPRDSFRVESLEETDYSSTGRNFLVELWGQLAPFFKLPFLVYAIVGCLLQAVLYAVASGLFLWYPDITNTLSNSASGMTICQALDLRNPVDQGECTGIIDDKTFIQSFINGAAFIAGFLLWGVMVKLLGNRTFFSICMLVSAVSTTLMCFVEIKMVIDALFIVTLVLPGVSQSVLSAMMIDLFPTQMCGMSVSLTLTAGRLGSVVTGSVVGLMLELDCLVTFLMFAASLLGNLLLSLLLPDPKRPKQPNAISEN